MIANRPIIDNPFRGTDTEAECLIDELGSPEAQEEEEIWEGLEIVWGDVEE